MLMASTWQGRFTYNDDCIGLGAPVGVSASGDARRDQNVWEWTTTEFYHHRIDPPSMHRSSSLQPPTTTRPSRARLALCAG